MNERLKKLRRELNLTQQEFADKIGSKRNTIAKYETSANTPSAAVVSLICKEFNVSEAWLRDGIGDMFIKIDKENQLMEWAGRVLSDESGSFRKRFISMLMTLDEKDWVWLEEKSKILTETEEE
jgi:HTH-type transcriptional regulator/antitoxin PezA